MTRLRISQQALEGVLILVGKDIDAIKRLAARLRDRVTVKLSIDDDVEVVVAESFPDDEDGEQRRFSGALIGLYVMLVASQRQEQVFLDDLAETLSVAATHGVLAEAREKLALLLGVPAIRITAKAWSLLEEQDKIFIDSRSVTDLRPIFGEDVAQPLAATIISHTLRISYRSDGKTGSIYSCGR